jgi:predicted glycoside hydrolase/deacetylase ChbG (UPF0249 family)
MTKFLIINADDFGASAGINRGILDCHTRGVVTSASLMVTGRAVSEAVAISRDYPELSIGLHWDVWGEDEREFDMGNVAAVRDEFCRQVDDFRRLLGREPTHLDSHRHAHRCAMPLFQELVRPLGVPLRENSRVRFLDCFYAQPALETQMEYVSVPFLQELLRVEVLDGWTELMCHPGYRSADYSAVYHTEREAEVRTLTDPTIRRTLSELDIQLASYADYLKAGHNPDVTEPERGRRDSWARDLEASAKDIAALPEPSRPFILVDDATWGAPAGVGGRPAIPFLERDGEYWGAPDDDAVAIAELERLRRAGAAFIAFAGSARWWLQHYAAFHDHLRSRYPCLLHNGRLVVFDLRPG